MSFFFATGDQNFNVPPWAVETIAPHEVVDSLDDHAPSSVDHRNAREKDTGRNTTEVVREFLFVLL